MGYSAIELLLVSVAGVLVGGLAVIVWQLRQHQTPAPSLNAPATSKEDPRLEARRYFLFNETGNVLIATTLSPEGRLPDETLALFSEAMAHLTTLLFAIDCTRGDSTSEAPSLYNYDVLRRALDRYPVFIRVSAESREPRVPSIARIQNDMLGVMPLRSDATGPQRFEDTTDWLERRAERSQATLGIQETPENAKKLKAIHVQMRAEALRLRRARRPRKLVEQLGVMPLQSTSDTEALAALAARLVDSETELTSSDVAKDDVEIGHITLYCECLMGVSLVSVKLAHAHYDDYLHSDALDMEQDVYLFVSPNQLEKTSKVAQLRERYGALG